MPRSTPRYTPRSGQPRRTANHLQNHKLLNLRQGAAGAGGSTRTRAVAVEQLAGGEAMGVNPLRSLRSVVRFRRPEFNRRYAQLQRTASIADVRLLARQRIPGGVFDYIDGAAEDEISYRRNELAFETLEFVPRILRDVSCIDTTTTLMGDRIPLPLALAPTGFTRMAHHQGEGAVARAAERARIPYCVSSLSTLSIEDVRAQTAGDLWFQVYVWRDKGLLEELLQRAAAAQYSTIVITVDTAVLGRRERDVRRGFTLPPRIGADTILDGLRNPRWTLDLLRAEPIVFANVARGVVGDRTDPVALADYVNSLFDPSLSWADIDWFRDRWPGRIVLKGIQSVDDALTAVKAGIDGIVISNHGGRQLDASPPPLSLVAPIRDAVGEQVAVVCDGGVRRGSHVLRAVASGADACMIGRPYLYGLCAGGQEGVTHVLDILEDGLRRSMALTGLTSIDEAGPELIRPVAPQLILN
jgi:L-lactate dehydrogenase (cytochrome)